MKKSKKIVNLESLAASKFNMRPDQIMGGGIGDWVLSQYQSEFPGWQEWSDKTGDHDCTNGGTDCTDNNAGTDAIKDSSPPTLVNSDGC